MSETCANCGMSIREPADTEPLRIQAATLDVGRLTRTLWNMPNNAERWLKSEGDTHEFAVAIAAEYARLAREPAS